MSLKTDRDLNPTSRTQYARALDAVKSKNYDYAINLIQAVLKDEPLFLAGRKQLRAAEVTKYQSLSKFQQQMVSMKVASAALKLSGIGKKEPADQLALAEEVLALDPFHVKANTIIGDAGVALGYPAMRAFGLETISKGKPTEKSILYKLAETYMEIGDPEKSVKTYERLLELDSKDGDALSALKNAHAALASKSGGWENEGATYRDIIHDKEGAKQREQENKIVKSHDAINDLIQQNFAKHEANPTNGAISKEIASLYLQKNDFASAIPWYQHAFAAGGNVDTKLEETIGELKLRHAEQELETLEATAAEQEDPEVKAQSVAEIEQKKNEIDQVRLDQAEARVRAYPNDGGYHFQLGEALYKVGEYKRALAELQQGLKQPNVRYQALNMMGLCFFRQGMLDLAIKRFSDAQSELPGMDELKKEITYNLGVALESHQEVPEALEQFKKIYEVDMAYRDVSARVESSYNS